MDFAERIRELAARIPAQLEHIRTEEACKNALVMPFINALGYNVFDPREVTPELVADVGTKKGEKVDYAILRDGKPIILFECKGCDCNLDTAQVSQLYRYYSATEAKFSVLTNGIVYRFFSDLDAPNKMDSKPFFEVDLASLDDTVITELMKFSKSTFDVGAILATAHELKYTKEMKRVLAQELQQPSEDLVRFFVSRVYEGRVTQAVKGQFTELTKRALQQFISERVSDRLKSALADEARAAQASRPTDEATIGTESNGQQIETTDLERDGFNVVRAIVSEVVDVRRVTLRDQQSYCAILLDDNNRRTICRLWFNSSRKHLGLFDDNKKETRVLLSDVTDIFKHAAQLKATAVRYADAKQPPQATEADPETSSEHLPPA